MAINGTCDAFVKYVTLVSRREVQEADKSLQSGQLYLGLAIEAIKELAKQIQPHRHTPIWK